MEILFLCFIPLHGKHLNLSFVLIFTLNLHPEKAPAQKKADSEVNGYYLIKQSHLKI